MRLGKKTTGGRYQKARKSRLFEKKAQPRVVRLGEKRTKILRTMGGNKKLVSLGGDTVNLIVKGKAKKAKIKNVSETPSNRFWARQNILVKGAIIETDLGKARITNRPSQEGQIQCILLEK